MTKPCALLFDTFGTIVDWRTSLIDDSPHPALGVALRPTGRDWSTPGAGPTSPSMEEVRQGQRPWTKLDDLDRSTLDELVEKFGIFGFIRSRTSVTSIEVGIACVPGRIPCLD